MNETEEKFRQLQKENRIRVECNKQTSKIDENLNVEIVYTCGHKEKQPFLKILEHTSDYEALSQGNILFQKQLKCNGHCDRRLTLLNLNPFKSRVDLQQINRLQHGNRGTAQLVIHVV